MNCISCKEEYGASAAGICMKCYDKSSKNEKELKQKIGDLNGKVDFLSFAPVDHTYCDSFSADLLLSDVVLVASDDGSRVCATVPVHKAVLMRSSPVFERMFKTDMKESRTGIVLISDVSYDALCAFVNYLNTAKAMLDEQVAPELLILAEKYQVEHLKTYCENFLVSILNLDNSLMSYAFAHQHNAKLLLDAALCFLTDNLKKLVGREDYKELAKKDPGLLLKIYEAYISEGDAADNYWPQGSPRFDDVEEFDDIEED